MGHDDEKDEDNKDCRTSDTVIAPPTDDTAYQNGIVTDLRGFKPSGLYSGNDDTFKKNNQVLTEYELNKKNNSEIQSSNKKMEAIIRSEIHLEASQKRGETRAKKKGWKNFWKRTMADMRNENLIPVKILFFFKAATLFVLYPFLTLHIKSLGLDAAEAGINSAFIPIVAIIGPPIAGVVADKIGNFKIFLAAMTLVTAGTGLLLLLVPVARQTVPLPADITFALGCGVSESVPYGGPLQLQMMEDSVCTLNMTNTPWIIPHPSDVQCGMVCPTDKSSSSLSGFSSFPLDIGKTYLMPGGKLTFKPFTDKKPDLICSRGDDSNRTSCFFGFAEISDNSSTTVGTEISKLELIDPPPNEVQNGDNVTRLTIKIDGPWTFSNYNFERAPRCIQGSANLQNETSCTHKCLLTADRASFCSNTHEIKVYDVALTFWMYTVFRIILGLGSATTWIMFEGAVLAILKECGGDYGLQRVSALLAAILVSPISGALIYVFNDFRPAFFLYAILQTLSAFLTLKIDLTFKKPADEVLGHLKDVLSQLEILVFFIAMFLSGSVWGYLESFLFWFLKNLGGNEVLMGLTISVGGMAGLPLLIFSRVIIKRIGHVNVLCLGLVFYCIRLLGYSVIQNPWACLPMEAMEAMTNSLAITAAATYAAALSTEQTIASIQGFMGALYFGIGRGAGSLIGGFLIKWYGDRVTFQIFAVAALVTSLLYFLINQSYLKKHSNVKRGLDLTNLRGDRFDEEANARAASNKTIEEPVTSTDSADDSPETPANASDVTKINGGYVGPCDINVFTDIPLDEEESGDKGKSGETPTTRPISFPQSSKPSTLSLDNRSAES